MSGEDQPPDPTPLQIPASAKLTMIHQTILPLLKRLGVPTTVEAGDDGVLTLRLTIDRDDNGGSDAAPTTGMAAQTESTADDWGHLRTKLAEMRERLNANQTT